MSRVTLTDGRGVEAVLQKRGSSSDKLVRLSDGSCWIIGGTLVVFNAAEYALIETAANAPRGSSVFDDRDFDWYSSGVWSNVKSAFEVAA